MNNFTDLINGDTPVLVDFYATWCGPCKAMHPILEELKDQLGEKVHILKLDIENRANIKVVQHFRIRSVPTLMIFRNGEMKWQGTGARGADELKAIIDEYAY